ncbi:hypothetical protein J6590_007407 [Homalodisca vitripennis]|nr:hypothetical protein J6590_007407 [Homalodisca vitripennis]
MISRMQKQQLLSNTVTSRPQTAIPGLYRGGSVQSGSAIQNNKINSPITMVRARTVLGPLASPGYTANLPCRTDSICCTPAGLPNRVPLVLSSAVLGKNNTTVWFGIILREGWEVPVFAVKRKLEFGVGSFAYRKLSRGRDRDACWYHRSCPSITRAPALYGALALYGARIICHQAEVETRRRPSYFHAVTGARRDDRVCEGEVDGVSEGDLLPAAATAVIVRGEIRGTIQNRLNLGTEML